MHHFIVEQLRIQGPLRATRDDIYEVLTDVICQQLGVKREDVTPGAHFVYDLGAD
jgi:acyl carrier protein